MFKYLESVNLSSYGMYLSQTSIKVEPGITTIDLSFTLPSVNEGLEASAKNLDEFFLDLQLLNKIRGSTSTAIQKQYQELLILLALSTTSTGKDK